MAILMPKVCVLDLVQLEDDIGYIKSSHTDLSSSNWTRSKTQTLVEIHLKKVGCERLQGQKCNIQVILIDFLNAKIDSQKVAAP